MLWYVLSFALRCGDESSVLGCTLMHRQGRKLAMRSMRTLFVLVLWEFELKPLPEKMASFAAKDLLTHQPQHSYVRLESQPL